MGVNVVTRSDSDPLRGIRVLIVEDESLIAEELRERLSRRGLIVVATVRTGATALEELWRLLPEVVDVVLMDVRLAGPMDGIATAAEIRQVTDIPIIYLTAHSDSLTLARAKHTAPDGYVLKPFQERDVLVAIEMAIDRRERDRAARHTSDAATDVVGSSDSQDRTASEDVTLADAQQRYAQLTSRQREVFALVALGRLNRQVASELGMTERTVKAHRAALMRRMHLASVADLARVAERLGL